MEGDSGIEAPRRAFFRIHLRVLMHKRPKREDLAKCIDVHKNASRRNKSDLSPTEHNGTAIRVVIEPCVDKHCCAGRF